MELKMENNISAMIRELGVSNQALFKILGELAQSNGIAVSNPINIKEVYVNSSMWSPVFRTYASDASGFGYSLNVAAIGSPDYQKIILPWVNINEVIVVTHDDLISNYSLCDISLAGSVPGVEYGNVSAIPVPIQVDQSNRVIRVKFNQPFQASLITLGIAGSLVNFAALPGKATAETSSSDVVSIDDYEYAISSQSGFLDDGYIEKPYSIFADVIGAAGSIDNIAISMIKNRINNRLFNAVH